MAEENRPVGQSADPGRAFEPGNDLARGTMANILKQHGIEPAPERNRKTTGKEFLSRHRELIVAADFFTIEVWTLNGLQRCMVPFFMELSTRNNLTLGPAQSFRTSLRQLLRDWINDRGYLSMCVTPQRGSGRRVPRTDTRAPRPRANDCQRDHLVSPPARS